jgi:hypothetical protein
MRPRHAAPPAFSSPGPATTGTSPTGRTARPNRNVVAHRVGGLSLRAATPGRRWGCWCMTGRRQPDFSAFTLSLGLGGAPDQDAGFWLVQPSAFGLLAPVVMTAQRGQVAGAGDPALVPGPGVVQVAAGGRLAATGRGRRTPRPRPAGSRPPATPAAGPRRSPRPAGHRTARPARRRPGRPARAPPRPAAARRHHIGLAVLGEPGHIQVLGRQAHEQALLRSVGRLAVLRPRPFRRGQRGAAGLLAVTPRAGERVLAHAPPSVRKKSLSTPRTNDYTISASESGRLANLFFRSFFKLRR